MRAKLVRGVILVAPLALLPLLAGCQQCLSPFDYCGPVISHDGCPNCDFLARRNSVYRPTPDTPPQALSPVPREHPSLPDDDTDFDDDLPPVPRS